MSPCLSWRPSGSSSHPRSTERPGAGRGAPNGCASRGRFRTAGARRRTPRWKSSWTWASAATSPASSAKASPGGPDGTIIKAISPRNQYVPLKLLGSGMAVDFYVEAAANPDLSQGWTFAATPYGDKATSGDEPKYRLGRIVIAELDQTVWELQQDVWTLSGLMHELPMELPRRHEILRALERMLDVMDPDDVAGHRRGRAGGPRRCPGPAGLRLGAPPDAPSATRTSTPPGCGRSARPSASAPAPSPTWSR